MGSSRICSPSGSWPSAPVSVRPPCGCGSSDTGSRARTASRVVTVATLASDVAMPSTTSYDARDAGVRLDGGDRPTRSPREHRLARRRSTPSCVASIPTCRCTRLHKRTLLALSWAIEDEFCAKAEQALIFGSFQQEALLPVRRAPMVRDRPGLEIRNCLRRLRGERRRVVTEARDPACRRTHATRVGRGLRRAGPARRAHGVELPGQADVPDRSRLFESMWSVDGEAVRDAARVCTEVALSAGVTVPAGDATWESCPARSPRSHGALQPNGGLRRPPQWVTDQRTTRNRSRERSRGAPVAC